MKPEIKPVPVASLRLIRFGNNQPVGLYRAIDFGDISSHDQAPLLGPGGLPGRQLSGPFESLLQQFAGGPKLLLVEELAELQRIGNRAVENLDIGQQFLHPGGGIAAETVNRFRQFGQPLFEPGPDLGGNFHTQVGDPSDGRGVVVARTIRPRLLPREDDASQSQQAEPKPATPSTQRAAHAVHILEGEGRNRKPTAPSRGLWSVQRTRATTPQPSEDRFRARPARESAWPGQTSEPIQPLRPRLPRAVAIDRRRRRYRPPCACGRWW